MGSIKNVISESIEGHEEYHIMVSLKSALQGVKSIYLNLARFIVLSSGTTETVIAKERVKWLTFAPEQCESSWNLVQLV